MGFHKEGRKICPAVGAVEFSVFGGRCTRWEGEKTAYALDFVGILVFPWDEMFLGVADGFYEFVLIATAD